MMTETNGWVENSTDDLEKVLGSTHANQFSDYVREQEDSLISSDRPFSDYVRDIIKNGPMNMQDVFLAADIPERYGYKLLTEEKRTRQRDVILRICYAAGLTLDQTQKALKLYGMPQLYAKVPRDAMLMICFNERPGDIIEVNAYLRKNKMEPLRSSGMQE